MKKNNAMENIGNVALSGLGFLGLVGLGVLAASAEADRLEANKKGIYKVSFMTPGLMKRCQIMEMNVNFTDEMKMKKYKYEFPHTRYSASEVREGDVIMCTMNNTVYMVVD